jgi:aminopeptidase N
MLGYTGYEPLADFVSLAKQADPAMDSQVQDALAGRLQGIDTLYEGLPGQTAFRAFGRRLLNPLFAKIGWDARKGESKNLALLRATLLEALSQFDDPAVIGEARKRFANYLKSPSAIAPDTRRSMLAIVARHADAATWDQLHMLAKSERSTMAKQELYSLLGSAHDRALAGRALALALKNEAAVTTRPSIVRHVGGEYPEMAFDFVATHLTAVNSWLEADSRNQFAPGIASNSNDTKMITELKSFADAHIPVTARSAVVKATSAIAFNAQVRTNRLPDVDRWLAVHGE